MMLTAWSHDAGSNWADFYHLDAVKAPLGIPDDVDVLAILPFGYPAQKIGAGKKNRKPLGEVFFSERFGQPIA